MIPRLPEARAFLARPHGARIGGAEVMTDTALSVAGGPSYALVEPIGRGARITPRNDPRPMAMRKLAPAPAAGLWTRDVTRAGRMADRPQAGTIWVNCWGETDTASPFGGIRASGYGREMGRAAIELYSQARSIWVA
jgi:acyl-CoA reductase-like NAD-dependent aldehyde dehydrogenase